MAKRAVLYRMVLPDHIRPFGERAKAMLEEQGYDVDDCLLTSREQIDAFKSEHGLSTTPLIVLDGRPIRGSEERAAYLRNDLTRHRPGPAGAFDW